MSIDEDAVSSRARSQSESAKSVDTSDERMDRAKKAESTGDNDEEIPKDAEIDEDELFGETAEESP